MLRDFESRLRRFASTFERRPFFNWFPRTSRATEGSCSRQFPCVEWKFGIDFSLFFFLLTAEVPTSLRETLPFHLERDTNVETTTRITGTLATQSIVW